MTRRGGRVGIIQSSYIPWRGYFDFIASVDLFIVFDDVQYPVGRSWRNRNQVKLARGLEWVTVPVRHRPGQAIDEALIGGSPKPWQPRHRRLLQESLGRAPYCADALAIWEEAVAAGDATISSLNVRLMRAICGYLGVTTPMVPARSLDVGGAKTERLLNLLRAVGATSYLSGGTARAYLDERAFADAGIRLEYKSYDYPPYPQSWGPFVGTVTVLDLIAHTGPSAPDHLRSMTADVEAVLQP